MNAEPKVRSASIEGYMIALDAGHSVALYERNGESYVAEFRDGVGGFAYAHTWFRFHAEALRYCRARRAVPHSSKPLTREMTEKIERLHAESEAREKRMLAVPGAVAATAQRYWTLVTSRLRRRAHRIARTFG